MHNSYCIKAKTLRQSLRSVFDTHSRVFPTIWGQHSKFSKKTPTHTSWHPVISTCLCSLYRWHFQIIWSSVSHPIFYCIVTKHLRLGPATCGGRYPLGTNARFPGLSIILLNVFPVHRQAFCLNGFHCSTSYAVLNKKSFQCLFSHHSISKHWPILCDLALRFCWTDYTVPACTVTVNPAVLNPCKGLIVFSAWKSLHQSMSWNHGEKSRMRSIRVSRMS